MPAKSTFERQDKINLVGVTVTVILLLVSILGVVLKFWNDTNVHFATLDQKVAHLEEAVKGRTEVAKVAMRQP